MLLSYDRECASYSRVDIYIYLYSCCGNSLYKSKVRELCGKCMHLGWRKAAPKLTVFYFDTSEQVKLVLICSRSEKCLVVLIEPAHFLQTGHAFFTLFGVGLDVEVIICCRCRSLCVKITLSFQISTGQNVSLGRHEKSKKQFSLFRRRFCPARHALRDILTLLGTMQGKLVFDDCLQAEAFKDIGVGVFAWDALSLFCLSLSLPFRTLHTCASRCRMVDKRSSCSSRTRRLASHMPSHSR